MQRAKDDIAHLYQEFGGKPQNYRELAGTREAERARERWPLISRVEGLSTGGTVPPVRAGEDPTTEPLRWLAGAAAAQTQVQSQAVPERIEPTLTHAQPETDAAAPTMQATQARHAADASAAAFTQARAAAPFPGQDGSGLFAALHTPQALAAAPAAPAASPAPPLASRACDAWHAPLPPVEPAAQAQQPSPLHWPAPTTRPAPPELPALEGRSPLARLAQTDPSPAPRASGLHNLFARLLGRDGS